MQKSRTRYTVLNTASGIFSRIILLIANFVIRTVFIKYLGIEYTGVSSVFSDILLILSFTELGIGSAITYALYKPIAENDYRQIARLMSLYKKAYILISIFILSIGLLLTPFINYIVPNTPKITENIKFIFFLYILNTGLSYLLIYKSVLLTASQKNYIISYINIIVYIAKTIFQVVVIIVFRMFILFLVVEIIFSVINNIIISESAKRKYPALKNYSREQLPKKEIKNIFKNIKALSLYKISGAVLLGSNGVIVSYFYGVGVVGYISNYTLIIQQLYTFALQFFNSITASIGNLIVTDDSNKQVVIFERAFFYTSFFFCISAVILFNTLSVFIGNIWLGSEYVIPVTIVIFLCVDFYLKGIASIVNSFRNANGLFTQGQYRPVIMVVLNIAFAILGIKFIGISGVYMGTVVARLITQIWFDPYILYKYAFKVYPKSFFKDLLVWFFVVVLSGLMSHMVIELVRIDSGILRIVFSILESSIVCLCVTYLFFNKNENVKLIIYIIGDKILGMLKKS